MPSRLNPISGLSLLSSPSQHILCSFLPTPKQSRWVCEVLLLGALVHEQPVLIHWDKSVRGTEQQHTTARVSPLPLGLVQFPWTPIKLLLSFKGEWICPSESKQPEWSWHLLLGLQSCSKKKVAGIHGILLEDHIFQVKIITQSSGSALIFFWLDS